MAATTEFTYRRCGDTNPPQKGVAVDPLSAITSGTTYSYRGTCIEIVQVLSYNAGTVTITFDGGPYNNCVDCYASFYDYVAVTDCINSNTYYFELSGFTEIPLTGETYFIHGEYRGEIFYNCFDIVEYGVFDPERPVTYAQTIDTPILSTNCTDCLNSSFLIYEVTSCVGANTFYVGLSSNNYADHLITFVDDLGDQYCGRVGATPVVATQTGTFISDYGVYSDNCNDCNSQVAEQRILTNCITGNQEIVWNSLFFNGGETSNLSSIDGCFSVGDVVTGETVTIDQFLNFDPQPNCQECIQCNGIQYNCTSCNNIGPISGISYSYSGTSVLTDNTYYLTGITNGSGLYSIFSVSVASNTVNSVSINSAGISYSVGDTITILGSDIDGGITPDDDITIEVNSIHTNKSVLSYQYLENPLGTVFYDPILNDCYEITSYETPTTYTFTISSLDTFDTCLDCTNQDHYVWYGVECGSIADGVAIITGVGFGVGDIVKVKIGDSNYLCYELSAVYNYGIHGPINSFKSLTTESYATCEECKNTVRLGVSVLSCETNEVSYVNIPLNAWYALAGHSEVFEGLVIADYEGNCYRVINTCVINSGGVNLDVQHIFTSCSVCYDYYHPVIHVNQYYETIVVGYLPGSGDTEGEIVTFNTPHPIWTDDDSRRTLIQDNGVSLGGFNGLNN